MLETSDLLHLCLLLQRDRTVTQFRFQLRASSLGVDLRRAPACAPAQVKLSCRPFLRDSPPAALFGLFVRLQLGVLTCLVTMDSSTAAQIQEQLMLGFRRAQCGNPLATRANSSPDPAKSSTDSLGNHQGL